MTQKTTERTGREVFPLSKVNFFLVMATSFYAAYQKQFNFLIGKYFLKESLVSYKNTFPLDLAPGKELLIFSKETRFSKIKTKINI